MRRRGRIRRRSQGCGDKKSLSISRLDESEGAKEVKGEGAEKKRKVVLREEVIPQVEYFTGLLSKVKGKDLGRWREADLVKALKWATFLERKKLGAWKEFVSIESPVQEFLDALLANPVLTEEHLTVLVDTLRDDPGLVSSAISRRIQSRVRYSLLSEFVESLNDPIPTQTRLHARTLKEKHHQILQHPDGENELRRHLQQRFAEPTNAQVELLCTELASKTEDQRDVNDILEDELCRILSRRDESSSTTSKLTPHSIDPTILSTACACSLPLFQSLSKSFPELIAQTVPPQYLHLLRQQSSLPSSAQNLTD